MAFLNLGEPVKRATSNVLLNVRTLVDVFRPTEMVCHYEVAESEEKRLKHTSERIGGNTLLNQEMT